MDKTRSKAICRYADKLDAEHKIRYIEKVENYLCGVDPYEVCEKQWVSDFDVIPPLDFPSLTAYLVCGTSAYTLDAFKSYKSLEAHQQFTAGWVHELKMFKPTGCDNTVIKAEVCINK